MKGYDVKQLLYVGKFLPWNDKHEDELYEALEIFDQVTIGVMLDKGQKKPKKGQPTKILEPEIRDRLTIVYYKSLKSLLKEYKNCKYILFDR